MLAQNEDCLDLGAGGSSHLVRFALSDGGFEVHKRLLPRYRGREIYEAILAHEFRVLQRVRHPLVVSALELREEKLSDFEFSYTLVMPWIEGRSLDQIWSSQELLTAGFRQVWARIFLQQAYAILSHVHSRSVVHGDICPHNFILGKDGFIRLIDFGSARFLDEVCSLEVLDHGHPRFQSGTSEKSMAGDLYSLSRCLETWLGSECSSMEQEWILDLQEGRWPRFLSFQSQLEPLPSLPELLTPEAGDLALEQTQIFAKSSARVLRGIFGPWWIGLCFLLTSWAPTGVLMIMTYPLTGFEVRQNGLELEFQEYLKPIYLNAGSTEVRFHHPLKPGHLVKETFQLESGEMHKIFIDFQELDTLP